MPATTATEFDATFFRGLFETDEASWAEFINVSLTSFKEAREQMAEAISTGDMETISKVRHAIGPSLTQWGAVTGKNPSPVGHLEHGGILAFHRARIRRPFGRLRHPLSVKAQVNKKGPHGPFSRLIC